MPILYVKGMVMEYPNPKKRGGYDFKQKSYEFLKNGAAKRCQNGK